MTGFLHVLAAAILLIALVLGLLLALISPFASYRYLISHGYVGQSLRHFWMRETVKGEVLAALVIVGGAATSGWILQFSLPRSSPIMRDVAVGFLVLSIVTAVVGPVIAYLRRRGEGHGADALRAWIKEAAGWELPTAGFIVIALMQLVPLGAPAWQVLVPLFIVLTIANSVVALCGKMRRERAGEGVSAHVE